MAETNISILQSKRGLDEAISEAGNALHALMRTAKDYLTATKNIVSQVIENIKFFKDERHEETDVCYNRRALKRELKANPHPFKGMF